MSSTGSGGCGAPRDGRGRRGGAARGRERGGRRGLRRAHLVHRREPADRPRGRRVHACPRSRAGRSTSETCWSTSSSRPAGPTAPSGAPSWFRSTSTSATRRRSSTWARPRAACPGTPAGLESWLPSATGRCRSSAWSRPACSAGARGDHAHRRGTRYFHEILHPILTSTPEAAALYAPEGRMLVEGDSFRFPDAGDALERFAAEGAEPFYTGEIGEAVCGLGARARRDPRARTTWRPTSRSSGSPSTRGSAEPTCSRTRRRHRAGS